MPILLLLLTLAACVTPVRRGSDTDEKAAPSPTSAWTSEEDVGKDPVIPKIDGVKKRIWILAFDMDLAVHPELQSIDIVGAVQKGLIQQFSDQPNSGFVPVLSDQRILDELHIDSSSTPSDVMRVARGSNIAGFLKGTIDKVEVEDRKEKEGIIQERDVVIRIEYSYTLFDATTGRELSKGSARRSAVERRSDLFNVTQLLRDPQGQIDRIARGLAVTTLSKINLFSSKIGWAGRILKMEGARIYVNAGRGSGLQVGDILKIVEVPRDVFDPNSGQFVGQAPGRVKGTAKIIQYFGLDGAVAILQSGGGINPGDRIELL